MTSKIQDAWLTAESDEPTFTLQAGDPLAAPLIRIWAQAARVMSGIISPVCFDFSELEKIAAFGETPAVKEQEELQARATNAEQISWEMDSFRQGFGARGVKSAGKISDTNQLDLYDVKQRACATLSQMRSILKEAEELLLSKNYSDNHVLAQFAALFAQITSTYNQLQPREDRKLACPR